MKRFQELFLLTGSNIEPRIDYLETAVTEVEKRVGSILQTSIIYESESWGFHDEIPFLNQVLLVNTKLSAEEVLSGILDIEKKSGRERNGNGYASRTLDIDILFFGKEMFETDVLTIPHPRLHERRFTLLPLADVAPDFVHPVFKISILDLLQKVQDDAKVWKYQQQ